jgi:hypothetical protein
MYDAEDYYLLTCLLSQGVVNRTQNLFSPTDTGNSHEESAKAETTHKKARTGREYGEKYG